MIHEVDESLRALIRRDVLDGADIEVSLEAPTSAWSARRSAPTINLFLYDIREDLERRQIAFNNVRDDNGRVTERRPPPRRFKLSYLITAWTQRPEDEHRLLSSLLATFLAADALPPDVLVGSLADEPLPCIVSIAMPPPEDRSFADTWTALGGELKPSLDLVVIAPFDTRRAKAIGPLVVEAPRLHVTGSTDEMSSRGRRRSAASRATTTELETVQGGTEDQPGRVVRVRGIPEG